MVKLLKQLLKLKTLLAICTLLSLLSLVCSYLASFIHPRSISLLPLFGLGYTLVFCVNVTLFFIWMFMKSKWSLVILFVLALGGRLHFRTFAFGSNSSEPQGTELKVLSYNVRLFDRYNANSSESLKTKNNILNFIDKKSPDVACFQEFYHQDAPTSFVTKDTIIEIMHSKEYHERYAHKLAGRQNFGVALFSKFPIISKGNVNFESQLGNHNFCIFADIVKNKDTFRVYNAHLQSIKFEKVDYAVFDTEKINDKEQSSNAINLIRKVKNAYPIRAKQAELVQQHMEECPYNIIVCGDFNDTPLSYTYNQFASHLTDAFRNTSKGLGSTYAGVIPVGRIDYIFHSKSLGSKDFSIQKEAFSDHYAIDCTVFVKDTE